MGRSAKAQRGFTLVELLVVIGIIALLISILLPALKKAQEAGQRTVCMSDQRQLAMAWRMYADDNKGWLPGSWPDQPLNDANFKTKPWIWGGNTERAIAGKGHPQGEPALWRYVKNKNAYHCPADWYVHNISYTMNSFLNGEFNNDCDRVTKFQSLKRPARTFIWIEEQDFRTMNNESYNLGSFMVPNRDKGKYWIDTPASWHGGGVVVSFADSHSEYHKWGNVGALGKADGKDLLWLQGMRGDRSDAVFQSGSY